MYFEWPDYYLRDRWLVTGDGQRCSQQVAPFPLDFTTAEAEAWLVEHDIRGTVRDEAKFDAEIVGGEPMRINRNSQ
jgi:hypothetical protein